MIARAASRNCARILVRDPANPKAPVRELSLRNLKPGGFEESDDVLPPRVVTRQLDAAFDGLGARVSEEELVRPGHRCERRCGWTVIGASPIREAKSA